MHQKHYLEPNKQLRKAQGKDLAGFLERKRARNESAVLGKQLPTIASKRLRGQQLEERKQQKGAELAAAMASAASSANPVKEEPAQVMERLKRLTADVADDRTLAGSSLRKARKKLGSDRGKKCPGLETGLEGCTGTASAADIDAEIKFDQPMRSVCLKLSQIPECLKNLSPAMALSGHKLGNYTHHAPSPNLTATSDY